MSILCMFWDTLNQLLCGTASGIPAFGRQVLVQFQETPLVCSKTACSSNRSIVGESSG